MLLPERALNHHGEIGDTACRRHLIVGEPHIRGIPTPNVHLHRLGLRHLEHAIDQTLRFIARKHGSVRQSDRLEKTFWKTHFSLSSRHKPKKACTPYSLLELVT